MYEDPIVAEIRNSRTEHTKKYNHNLDQICEALLERQKNSARTVVTRSPRPLSQKTKIKPLYPPQESIWEH
jgi:hypothetical protein